MSNQAVFTHKWAEVTAKQHKGTRLKVKAQGFLGKPLYAKDGQWIVTNRLGEVTVVTDKDFRLWWKSNNYEASVAFGEAG